MKTIAITGASGVVGTRLREYLKNTQYIIFDDDIRDERAVKIFCRETATCDAFIHLAALVPKQAVDSDPTDAFDVNVRGTLNVLDGLRQLRGYAPWMFFASSSHVYASTSNPLKEDSLLDPFTLYGVTKLQGEQWCKAYAREFSMKICVARLFSFSDPLQSNLYFIPAMINKISNADKNSVLEIPGINGERDFITVPQICQTIQLLWGKKFEGVINVGTGTPNHLLAIVKRIAELLGRQDLIIRATEDTPTYHIADTTLLKSLNIELTDDIDPLLLKMISAYK